jgi:acetyl-CoA synthetase
MFLEYWRNPAATAEKFAGEYLLTGDLGRQDEAGYFWFQGRSDDVITSAGYRIGPGEIEDCLMKHPAVALAAAVGVPDPLRTEIVKAFLVLKPGHDGTSAPRRIRRCAADDSDRQGHAARAAQQGVTPEARILGDMP